MAPEQKYFDFKTILLLKFYLTGHAESYCHLQHQEHNGRSSVTDKGQGDTCIALQVILNIAVVLNLMPNTGVTLPFISYGGTSIVFLMLEDLY